MPLPFKVINVVSSASRALPLIPDSGRLARRTAWRPIRLTRNEARLMGVNFAKLAERCGGRRR